MGQQQGDDSPRANDPAGTRYVRDSEGNLIRDRRTPDQQRARNILVYTILGLLTALTLLSLYGAFWAGPRERAEIRETADKAETTSDALAKSNAGLTALICTGSNRHDEIDSGLITVLLDEEARDVDGEKDYTEQLNDTLAQIPPPTNCGELICQFFREVKEPGAKIEIHDPFGPDREKSRCGSTAPPAGASPPEK